MIRDEKYCIKRFSATVIANTEITLDDLAAIDAEVHALIDNAVEKAVADSEPGPETLLTDVYIKY